MRPACRFPTCRTRCSRSTDLGAGALHLHVRVDGEVRRGVRCAYRHPCRRRRDDQSSSRQDAQGLRAVRAPGGRHLHGDRRHARRHLRMGYRPYRLGVADLELPKWIAYLCIPLGSYLMCFRFLQVAWSFARTGELPHHDVAHVEGIEAVEDINPYALPDNLHPADVAGEAANERRAAARARATALCLGGQRSGRVGQ